MRYTFRLLNHLGEPHEAHHLICDDNDHAIACGRELLHRGYPVAIIQEDRCVTVLKPLVVILDDFVRHLLKRGPVSPQHEPSADEYPDNTEAEDGAALGLAVTPGDATDGRLDAPQTGFGARSL
jgi:hypothetical protein